ncbi:MAG: hypothetical protein GC136_00455 [Alphaproteobacteria bacterium]|nr:hypothetical protein [Alphaproteobacteria bacterium]
MSNDQQDNDQADSPKNNGKKAPSNTLWTAAELMPILGFESSARWFATGVCTDENELQEGDIYIPVTSSGLVSDSFGGGDFIEHAMKRGAAAVITEEQRSSDQTLRHLAQAARARCGGKVIAVTGYKDVSNFMDMLAQAFGVQGQLHRSRPSASVPLALSQMHAGTDFAIIAIPPGQEGDMPLLRPDLILDANTKSPVHMEEIIEAGNGTRVTMCIGAEKVTCTLPTAYQPMHAASALWAVKMLGGNVQNAVAAISKAEGGKKVAASVALLEKHKRDAEEARFNVLALIEFGSKQGRKPARRMAVLCGNKPEGAILPARLAGMELLYAGQASVTIKTEGLNEIVPEVLTPHDVIVMRPDRSFTTLRRTVKGTRYAV